MKRKGIGGTIEQTVPWSEEAMKQLLFEPVILVSFEEVGMPTGMWHEVENYRQQERKSKPKETPLELPFDLWLLIFSSGWFRQEQSWLEALIRLEAVSDFPPKIMHSTRSLHWHYFHIWEETTGATCHNLLEALDGHELLTVLLCLS